MDEVIGSVLVEELVPPKIEIAIDRTFKTIKAVHCSKKHRKTVMIRSEKRYGLPSLDRLSNFIARTWFFSNAADLSVRAILANRSSPVSFRQFTESCRAASTNPREASESCMIWMFKVFLLLMIWLPSHVHSTEHSNQLWFGLEQRFFPAATS